MHLWTSNHYKTFRNIDQLDNSSQYVLLLIHIPQDLVGQSLIGPFENMNPDMTSIHVSVSVVIVVIVCCHLYILIYCSQATCQFWSKLGRNVILVFLNILYDFHLIWKFNPGPILLSDCLKLKKSSSLKQHMEWKCYLERMFLWPSKKFMFFLSIKNPRWWPSQDIWF